MSIIDFSIVEASDDVAGDHREFTESYREFVDRWLEARWEFVGGCREFADRWLGAHWEFAKGLLRVHRQEIESSSRVR
ncbi:hypothetical protein B296_00014063 [Ensete ventricosum]|uniref:Uncharacterized protein n=1 Tax=Ensete ventricosum TaxID=4639 RepID=A0A426ZX51_ENSVE|nr:hypothetical protein B296_00014063 [Ensete ventricosum]